MKHKPGKGQAGKLSTKEAAYPVKEENEDQCRCKQVSEKTIPEMLKVMLNDLAIWRKNKK